MSATPATAQQEGEEEFRSVDPAVAGKAFKKLRCVLADAAAVAPDRLAFELYSDSIISRATLRLVLENSPASIVKMLDEVEGWLERDGRHFSRLLTVFKNSSALTIDFAARLVNNYQESCIQEDHIVSKVDSSTEILDAAALEEAAKEGFIRVRSRNILITGAGGAGKTCTMSVMIGKDPSSDPYTSTGPSTSAVRIGSIPELLVGDVLSGVKFKLLKGNTLLRLIARGVQNCKQSSKRPAIKQSGSEVCREATESRELKGSEQHDVVAVALAKNVLSSVMEIIKEHPTLQPIAEVELLHIIDSGGQLQFHEIINKFVTNLHATLYVTDIRKDPEDNVMDQFYVNGEPWGEPYESHYTHEQLFKRSLQALQLQKRSAKLAVAATHIDKVGADKLDEAIEKKDRWILDIAKSAAISEENLVYRGDSLDEIVFPFHANNLSNSEGPVRNLLEHLCDDERVPPEIQEIPMRRFLLEQTMQEHSERSRGIVTVTECLQIGLEFEMTPELVEEALQYLSNHNLILYVPEVINDLVFCEVQTPLSAVKQIVQYSAKVRAEVKSIPKTKINPANLSKLATKGTLTLKLLTDTKEFESLFDSQLFSAEKFLKLIEHFKIIARKSPNEYFMPCILRELPEGDLKNHYNANVQPLLLYFSEWPQAGVFCTLVTQLISKYGWQPIPFKAGGVAVECLYRNCIKFEVNADRNLCCDVTLIESYDSGYFEVHINLPQRASPDSYKTLCPQVRQMLLDSSPSDVQPKDALICSIPSCEDPKRHAAVFDTDGLLRCTKGPQKIRISRDDNLCLWRGFPEPNQNETETEAEDITGLCPCGSSGQDAPSSASDTLVVSPEDVPQLLRLLKELAGSWQLFLGQLGVPNAEVDAIQLARAGSPNSTKLCMSDGLHYWINSSESPTYSALSRALYTHPKIPLAKRLEKYVRENHGAQDAETFAAEGKRILHDQRQLFQEERRQPPTRSTLNRRRRSRSSSPVGKNRRSNRSPSPPVKSRRRPEKPESRKRRPSSSPSSGSSHSSSGEDDHFSPRPPPPPAKRMVSKRPPAPASPERRREREEKGWHRRHRSPKDRQHYLSSPPPSREPRRSFKERPVAKRSYKERSPSPVAKRSYKERSPSPVAKRSYKRSPISVAKRSYKERSPSPIARRPSPSTVARARSSSSSSSSISPSPPPTPPPAKKRKKHYKRRASSSEGEEGGEGESPARHRSSSSKSKKKHKHSKKHKKHHKKKKGQGGEAAERELRNRALLSLAMAKN